MTTHQDRRVLLTDKLPAPALGTAADRSLGDPDGGLTDPDGGGGADFELFDPSFLGGDDDLLLVGVVAPEEGGELPSDRADQLSATAFRHLSNTRSSVRKKAALVGFSEEDFEEGPQRDAFVIVRSFKQQLFASGPQRLRDAWAAIEFFFTLQDNGDDVTFDLCCRALDARIDVLRLRIQYEFFLRWWVAPTPFPFMTVPVPDIIEGEILYAAGQPGMDLARRAWLRPGISTEALIDGMGPADTALRLLERLDDKMLLCRQGADSWYLTGRNPYLLRLRLAERDMRKATGLGSSIHWSRLL